MFKIYQIHKMSGEYEDYCDVIVGSYLHKEKAERELEKFSNTLNASEEDGETFIRLYNNTVYSYDESVHYEIEEVDVDDEMEGGRMKDQEHIPGKPMYSVGDRVSFQMTINGNIETFDGTIEIVDRFGAWDIDYPSEPSYDILVENWRGRGTPTLVKHIRESNIVKTTKG